MGLCIAAGLVGGEAFSIDASLIKADVDKKKLTSGDRHSPHRGVRHSFVEAHHGPPSVRRKRPLASSVGARRSRLRPPLWESRHAPGHLQTTRPRILQSGRADLSHTGTCGVMPRSQSHFRSFAAP